MPHRPGLIVAVADPDDSTVYHRAAAIGAEAVIRAGQDLSWVHLRLHDTTQCRYAHWEALLTGGPADPPRQPAVDARLFTRHTGPPTATSDAPTTGTVTSPRLGPPG
ncbi:hypothetical protein ACWGQ5_47610 [Streptomyces sp. NPDC055722]